MRDVDDLATDGYSGIHQEVVAVVHGALDSGIQRIEASGHVAPRKARVRLHRLHVTRLRLAVACDTLTATPQAPTTTVATMYPGQ